MTNYIIESDIDFFKELCETTQDLDDSSDVSKCLLTGAKLTDNYIRLSCGHTFNYIPLFKELHTNKYIINKGFYIQNNIKCPYCRSYSNFILPYIPTENSNELYSKKINGINHPPRFSLKLHNCQWSRSKKNYQLVQILHI